MTITQQNYLDIPNLLINEIFGDTILFTITGMVLITYFSVKYRIPIGVILVFNLLFAGAMVSYATNNLLWMIVLFVAGISIYALYAKLFKR